MIQMGLVADFQVEIRPKKRLHRVQWREIARERDGQTDQHRTHPKKPNSS
jgi:hypothetical protein